MRRGSTLIESTLITTVFLLLLIGIGDFGRLGFAYNSITFAAHRAARWAATRGNASGHPASAADIQSDVRANLVALDVSALTVGVTWTPDNHPGSKVAVQVSYSFQPLLIPVSAGALTLQSSSTQIIAQ
jgi:Flp pilus assembly protein TadG